MFFLVQHKEFRGGVRVEGLSFFFFPVVWLRSPGEEGWLPLPFRAHSFLDPGFPCRVLGTFRPCWAFPSGKLSQKDSYFLTSHFFSWKISSRSLFLFFCFSTFSFIYSLQEKEFFPYPCVLFLSLFSPFSLIWGEGLDHWKCFDIFYTVALSLRNPKKISSPHLAPPKAKKGTTNATVYASTVQPDTDFLLCF